MPRGVPNAKRDESALRYTSFHVPLPPNPKHLGSTYLKSESQTIWSRNAARSAAANRQKLTVEESSTTPAETRRGSRVLVIHPGSRFLRVGRASDVTPTTVPHVIARKHKEPVTQAPYIEGIVRPQKEKVRSSSTQNGQNGDEYAVPITSDDPFETKVAAIMVSLRERMRFYKLRVTQNADSIASTFNEQFVPEVIPEVNDPFRIKWIQNPADEVIVGEKALRIADPTASSYLVRWPLWGSKFNTRDYPSTESIVNDIEAILRTTLKEQLNINERSYKDFSVVLVIPDFYDRFYVQVLVRMLLVSMGFKQLCAQQESLAATYGAGVSNACVIDMGAATTSIACVDDGLVIPDTRMTLNMGGNDVTEFLYVLLGRINFPYKDADLARSFDWNVMEDLKSRLCTLAEGDVALNLYDFVVRRPGKPTEKYGLRAYDEIILAPMCLFEPRVIEFEKKRVGLRSISHQDVTDEIVEQVADHVTQAMVISTQHLLPTAILPLPEPSVTLPPSGPQTPGVPGQTPVINASETVQEAAVSDESATPMDIKKDEGMNTSAEDTAEISVALTEGVSEEPVEIINVDESDSKPEGTPEVNGTQELPDDQVQIRPTQTFPGGYAIDVCFEASKLPLDVAIFNSARAAGGDEKIRKYLQAVLIIGGTALVPGMAHALESRLQAIATPLVPNMEKVQIIPPPKDVDPRVLAWKGAAVLGKMDGVADLWITAADWDVFGMRALKERCFFL